MANTKKLFVDGPILPDFIAKSIASHAAKTNIGAHQIFLGQIRADIIDNKQVSAIDFSAYVEMAEEKYYGIREELFAKYNLSCMHVYHSLGEIKIGEINLFVFMSSAHRKDAIKACAEMVEKIKTEVPIWGKLIFENETNSWKINQ